ncbi:MAG: glycogen synthase [Clostridia bacterium]|nr:glycogen synthase [Clostridia bacterium]
MRVLYVTSEAMPFAYSGGLAEVAGCLPYALRQRLVTCRVVMPLYEGIPQELKDSMKFIVSLSVPVAWRRQYCGVFEARYRGVDYYFIDNQYYFKRKGYYGHYDDAERFAFFSRAVLEMLPYVDYKPDIIHANDWQTALVPVYYHLFYSKNEWFYGTRTVFTIHNIQYQGKYGMELVEEVLGIPEEDKGLVEFDGSINLLKGAIETANIVTTSSQTYAEELRDPWFSFGLDSIIRDRWSKIRGILNGLDTASYNPETDMMTYAQYSDDSFIAGKAVNKRELQRRLFLPERKDVPMIGMVSSMITPKGMDILRDVLEELLQYADVQFVILGSGDWEYEEYFRQMQEKYRDKFVACFGFIPELARKIYAASDMFLMPSKLAPGSTAQMVALRYGSIPIVRETGALRDSVSDSADGYGNGFVFQAYNGREMLNAIYRALGGYSHREGWWILVRRAMNCDNSWKKRAKQYHNLYKELINEE